MKKSISILGTRGVPASHGGFETFAEQLSLYLVDHGWDVCVYCQVDGSNEPAWEDYWHGIRRVFLPIKHNGAIGTVMFDWKSVLHVVRSKQDSLILTLGYNTAVFCSLYRACGRVNLINMDGVEWRRDKWKWYEKAWLWLNERIGCVVGNHLIADHPSIADHLASRVNRNKITMIPYGANEILKADIGKLRDFGVDPGRYVVVIARPEPENSILEIVKAFSRKPRGMKMVLLGRYDPDRNLFHKLVMEAAGDEVLMVGAIYDKSIVESLRYYARLYIHGHRVGGTNPSLVEALGAGLPVLAHDNQFNRWVVGNGAHYFHDESSCAIALDRLLEDDEEIARMANLSRERYQHQFTWNHVLEQYEALFLGWLRS